VFKPATVPRSANQLKALQLVLNLSKSTVIVIQTTERKSALFLVLTVLAKQKTVIVIVLYTALVKDLARSAVKAGINCQR
jgi:hypothetical protein